MTPKSPFRLVGLDALQIDDERSMRHVGLYALLKEVLLRDGYRFRVPRKRGATGDWNRATMLNLSFWSPADSADVLVDDHLPADVVAHVAWHHLARRQLGGAAASADGLLLGESIASAFDVYLVGRLLGHAPRSTFLRTQVPAMSEVAASAGLDGAQFESLLGALAADPEKAFGDLQSLLFRASTTLLRAADLDEAAALLEGFSRHPYYPLLHHYNLSNWILYARAWAPKPKRKIEKKIARVFLDIEGAEPSGLDWLERRWLGGKVTAAVSRRGKAPLTEEKKKR